jgi:lipid-binding SYLF domain-containing protein
MKYLKIFIVVLLSIFLISCAKEATPDAQRQELLKESQESLSMLYKEHPGTKAKVAGAYGYATFQNFGLNLFLISTERGSGVAHNNKTGQNTYMNMFSGGVGPGLGAKDFRAIFIFDNKEVFDSFVEDGWEANAQADAAAQSDEKGGSLDGAVTVASGVTLYKLTKNGLALQATVQGTKYWKDDDLN